MMVRHSNPLLLSAAAKYLRNRLEGGSAESSCTSRQAKTGLEKMAWLFAFHDF
jgi:hypothetical protein